MTVKFVNREEAELSIKRIKKIYEENKTLKLKLAKYKRAFEILNLNFTLICKEDEYLCNKEYYLLSDTYTKIEKEEAELLEELMGYE